MLLNTPSAVHSLVLALARARLLRLGKKGPEAVHSGRLSRGRTPPDPPAGSAGPQAFGPRAAAGARHLPADHAGSQTTWRSGSPTGCQARRRSRRPNSGPWSHGEPSLCRHQERDVTVRACRKQLAQPLRRDGRLRPSRQRLLEEQHNAYAFLTTC